MQRYLLRRVLMSIPVVLGAMTLVFFIVHAIPGDPALFMAGENAPIEVVEEIRRQQGLDQPVVIQYWNFMRDLLLKGDFGYSVVTGTPVRREIMRAFPNTVALTLAALLWSVSLGVILGVISAVNRSNLIDRATMSVAVSGVAFPGFFTALLLMYFLAFRLGWFPLSGVGSSHLSIDGLRHLFLPAIALGFGMLAQ
ncbi:MAG: ABC transporter permease, partial [Bacillota bacterium]|nr:ABC transporter permease [Bacillota bacterium]